MFATLWLPLPQKSVLTYRIPASLRESLQVGDWAWAPLGKRKLVGLVQGISQDPPKDVPEEKLRELLEKLPDEQRLDAPLLDLLRWTAKHYLSAPGEVLKTLVPGLILKGETNQGEKIRLKFDSEHFFPDKPLALNSDQRLAVDEILEQQNKFQPFLLQGITGSGKTEVYLKLTEAILAQEGSVLVLVPEIALTPQIYGRYVARFGERVAIYHSGLTELQRLRQWWDLKKGLKRVVIGTRSAVALPCQNLSLVVVDEEHDASYKQDERLRYHGRDLAVLRAKLQNVPVVLGTATPSVETRENVENGKYRRLKLEQRATEGVLPQIEVVDLRKDFPDPDTLLSLRLEEKIAETLARGEQVLLFLNRRGYSPSVICRACGDMLRCPNCEITLTYHYPPASLQCHYCDFARDFPHQCPGCQGPQLEPLGVGTKRLEAGLLEKFPGLKLARLDRDVATSRLKTEAVLKDFAEGKLDMLIGTQLVTKGHDFRRLTLVGILLADLTLTVPDFRASERLFQILTQVAGRAGRHDLAGEVILQTYRPEHPSIQTAIRQDPELFFYQEKPFRQHLNYPPFSRLVLLRFLSLHEARARQASEQTARQLQRIFPASSQVQVLGPAKSTLEKLRGKYRWQILLRSPRYEKLRGALEKYLPTLRERLPAGVQCTVDVDPMGVF